MHIGDITTRFGTVKSRKVKGVNMGGGSAAKFFPSVIIVILFSFRLSDKFTRQYNSGKVIHW